MAVIYFGLRNIESPKPQYIINVLQPKSIISQMVLLEFGSQIKNTLDSYFKQVHIGIHGYDKLINDIVKILLKADVNFQLVCKFSNRIKERLVKEDIPGANKERLIRRFIEEELISLLEPGRKPKKLLRKKSNVIMLLGLQGSGKTTTAAKLSYYYKKKGWKTCLVGADTFRAGAKEQLKQNALRCNIPYYIDFSTVDPVKVAYDGVNQFKKEKYEIIIVDTSGKHKQENELFKEMQQIVEVIKPDLNIFVMDSTIGQAAKDQVQAFSNSVDVGGIILTKLDGGAKGGGALSAVASTNSPILFLGNGEHMDDLDTFESKGFVRKLLGYGDFQKVAKEISNMPNVDIDWNSPFTLRDMYKQFNGILNMGSVSRIIENLPMVSNMFPKGTDPSTNIKKLLTIMDSMNASELDAKNPFQDKKTRESRFLRIARGSGSSINEVKSLISQHKAMQRITSCHGKKFKGNFNPNLLNPQMVQAMGGQNNIQHLLKQMKNLK